MIKKEKAFIGVSLLAVFILCLVCYGNSLKGKFIWDDKILIMDNAYLKSWYSLPLVFTRDIGFGSGQKVGFYRPLQLVSYMLDYALWKMNSAGYHFSSIVLHGLVACSIFWFASLLCGNRMIALAAAGLFVAHPLHTEAVAYISGRADSLAALCILLSFAFYLKYLRAHKFSSYLIALISFLCSLFSKESSLIFPLLLLGYHFVFKEKAKAKLCLPFIAFSIAYIFLRWSMHTVLSFGYQAAFWGRLQAFFYALSEYARLLLFPRGLHMEYGSAPLHASNSKIIIGIAILILTVFFIIRRRNNDAITAFSLWWFLVGLIPVSNLYPVNAFMAEHWLYLPSVGIFILGGHFFSFFMRRHKKSAIALVMGILMSYACLTIKQNSYWLEPIPFFKRTLQYAPYSSNAYVNLALAYADRGKVQEAISAYKVAIALNPSDAKAYANLGGLYASNGKFDEAISFLCKALGAGLNSPGILGNLGSAYALRGDYEQALKCFQESIELNPEYVKGYLNKAAVHTLLSQEPEAMAAYTRLLKIDPGNAHAHYFLGGYYYKAGSYDDAVREYTQAARFEPRLLEAYITLGRIFAYLRRYEKSVYYFRKAIGYDPHYVQAYNDLGVTYARMKKWRLARLSWEKALRFNPGDKEAQENLKKLNQ